MLIRGELQMTEKPVIVKLHPQAEEFVEAETAFLRAVGLCITRWAFVDRQLFRLFRIGIGASTHRAAILYYDQQTISRRLSQVDALLKSAFADAQQKEYEAEWKRLRDRMNELLPTRNIIAHQPVQRLGTSDGKKAVYIYGIYLEPYQRYLNKTYQGLRGKDALRTDDLVEHANAVDDLENDLKLFVRKMVHSSRAAETK
jgi:hypothetical protein